MRSNKAGGILTMTYKVGQEVAVASLFLSVVVALGQVMVLVSDVSFSVYQ